jgi:hypothetical protein|tara:strand:- start:823 stop:1104 length:282 start_codon:yes stop_codon:yes gene_type:complete
MANFTIAQASASKIETAEKNYVNSSFGYWTFRVSGSDGESKFWVDHDLAENANSDAIQDAVFHHMTGSEEYFVAVTPPVVSGSMNDAVTGSIG